MTISSTKFQQRVGYYLSLVERGMEIIVERKKPGRKLFLLSMSISPDEENTRAERERFLQKWKALRIRFPEKDGVAYQRRVRQ